MDADSLPSTSQRQRWFIISLLLVLFGLATLKLR